MKIVVIGAGKVGTSIIENFNSEQVDLVVIDQDQEVLDQISAKYDLLTIKGSATDLNVLDRAGVKSANIFVACTSSDEINILSCKLARDIYHVQLIVSRLRNQIYLLNRDKLFNDTVFPIDYIIEPTMIMAHSLYNLIQHPGTTNFTYFYEQNVCMFTCRAEYGGIKIGKSAIACRRDLEEFDISFVALIRNNIFLRLTESTVINANDEVILVCRKDKVGQALSYFQRPLLRPRSIMLAGGSKINFYLASMLAGSSVKIIEIDHQVATNLSNELSNVLVIEGDCSDENLLYEERIDSTDLFIAATNSDNINVLTGMLAKRLGAKRVFAMVGKSSNLSLIKTDEIDLIYSGKNDLATELRSNISTSNFSKIYRDTHGHFAIVEYKLNQPHLKNRIVGIPTKEIKLPEGARIIGRCCFESYFVVNPTTVFNSEERAIILFENVEALDAFKRMYAKNVELV